MNTWLLFAIMGQFLYALVVLTDRFIVSRSVVSKPIVYAFYISILSIFAVAVVPFGVVLPTGRTILLSIAVAVSFIASIYMLYESLRRSKPTEVAPVVGGVAAIAAFIGSSLILKTTLPGNFLLGFVILVGGMIAVSHFKFNFRSFLFLTGSGIFFGLSSVFVKAIFAQDTFINGFFWSRMANVAIALVLLLIPRVFKAVALDIKRPNKSRKATFVVGNKLLGALGFVLTLVAIKYGDATLVNALTATQYVFLIFFAIFFSRFMPEYFNETVHRHEFLHKFIAVFIIFVGFFVLFI